MTRRIALEISYDGTDFLGWQRQSEGRTVQGTLERFLTKVSGNNPVTLTAAGRTDTGVHSHGQVAHADVTTNYDDQDLLHALNRMSPPDVVIRRLSTVGASFHSRYDARKRTYRYTVLRKPDPFLSRYGWYIPVALNLDLLRMTSESLLGEHDFTSLSKNNPDTHNMVCNLHHATWSMDEERLEFTVTANRFLYGMVRLLVGLHYDIGRGARSIGEVENILLKKDRSLQSMAVPPVGLSLYKVDYERSPFAGIVS